MANSLSGATAKGAEEPASDGKTKKPGIEEWFLKTAGTIIGGLGLAGSMVVIGSAVLWTRFGEAGLPAIQSVSVQDRQEALVQGAQTTIVFVLIALAVVAALYVADGRDLSTGANEGEGTRATEQADQHRMGWRAVASVCVLPILGILWAILGTELGAWAVAALGLLAVLLTIGCIWMAYSDSKNFWALAAAVFVSVIVFAGLATYLIVKEQRFIQPVAVLRGEDDSGLRGFYVSANGDELYLGVPVSSKARPDDKSIQKVDLGESVTYSVGPLQPISEAEESSKTMLEHLIADEEGESGRKTSRPRWIPKKIAATFRGKFQAKEKAPRAGLCLMRFTETVQKRKKGSFWTSCAEAEAQETINDARERLALPGRFQKNYEVRVKVEVPGGSKLRYAQGTAAPQCGGDPGQPCGHSYPGGGIQYWIKRPRRLAKVKLECTESLPDQKTVWKPCKKRAG